jgi:VWFA-related protein
MKCHFCSFSRKHPNRIIFSVLLIGMLLWSPLVAQNSQSQSPPQPQQNPPVSSGEAGGPGGNAGPVIVPKKNPDEAPPETPRPAPRPKDTPQFSMSVDTTLVTVPVSVITKNGSFVPSLQRDNFRIYEDGVQQTITQFSKGEAPITAVLLVEFSHNPYIWSFMIDSLKGSYYFLNSLKKDDWVALMEYDMKPHILQDFTQDRRALMGALSQLRPETAGFSETNLFDALNETIDRLSTVEGRKYIILVGSGCDSFSKLTYDKALKIVKGVKDTTIYAVSTGRYIRNMAEASNQMRYLPCAHGAQPGFGPIDEATTRMDFLQADNALNTFAKMTGGQAFFPTFEGQFPAIFQDIGSNIRNQYVLAYRPTNAKQDGTFRKLKVEVLDPQTGKPVVIKENGKEVKYSIVARDGYTAKHEVE